MIEQIFTRMATRVASWSGSPAAFGGAVGIVLIWAVLGPASSYSEVWQLAINTGTTIVTFLMVFIIQNSQNRDTRALQIKIDELLVATKGANDSLIDLENASEGEIEALHLRYCEIAARARELGLDFGAEEPPPRAARQRSEPKKRRKGAAANGSKRPDAASSA